MRVPSVAGMIALKPHAMPNQRDRLVRDTQDIQAILRLNSDAVTLDDLRAFCVRYGPPGIYDLIRNKSR